MFDKTTVYKGDETSRKRGPKICIAKNFNFCERCVYFIIYSPEQFGTRRKIIMIMIIIIETAANQMRIGFCVIILRIERKIYIIRV